MMLRGTDIITAGIIVIITIRVTFDIMTIAFLIINIIIINIIPITLGTYVTILLSLSFFTVASDLFTIVSTSKKYFES